MATSNTIAYNKGFGSSPGNPPGRKDAPLSIISKVFNEFDQDDFVSVKFLLNGLSSKFNLDILENSNLLVLEHADLLKKATVFQSFSPNDPNALKLLLKEILFVIKRYDLLQKYFNTCEHIMDGKEKTSTLIDPYWQVLKKLYMVYDNIGDSRYSLFKYHLGFDKDVTDCSTLLIKWYKTCELPPQQKIEHLAYILEKIGEKKVADRILGQQNLEEYYPMDSNPCGTVVIFNQIEFDNSMLEDRNGTNVDRGKNKMFMFASAI
ncbi:hypothetical protein GQR58_011316 [Nymphon striatum]|nr:hypothetical protein GQR58_011316 [Nymphon striatum]